MSMSRKIQRSKWRDGQRRRSPRISALDAWKQPHQPTNPTFSSNKDVCDQHSDQHHHHQRPPSRTRAGIKRKLHPPDVESPNLEDRSTNSDQPLVAKHKGSTQLADHATKTGQQSGIPPPFPLMPEKRILEFVLDILQRRDTYEIFGEPVNHQEVEDYYEIIKEPMDFGTMRAKLHEGLYQNLEQFEHDAFLIPRNAMHFNSTATVYFRQARAIYELAKRVFHVLKNDPQNFELEFSGTRRRSGRRLQGEVKSLDFNSSPRLAANVRSSHMTADVSSKGKGCSVSCPSNLKRSIQENSGFACAATCIDKRGHDFYRGRRGGRRSNFVEVDRRCKYRPLMSFHDENDFVASTFYGDPKQLARVNQQGMSYRESLMLFAKDLGPIAQMGQAPTCQVQKGPAISDTILTHTSPGFLDPLPSCWSGVKATTTDIIDLTDADDGEKAFTRDSMGNHSAFLGRKVASNNEGLTSRECDGMKIFDKQISTIHMGLYSSTSRVEDLNSSKIIVNDTGKKSMAATVDSGKTDNQLRSSASSTASLWPWHTKGVSSFSQTHGKYESVALVGPKGGMSSSSLTSHDAESNQLMPLAASFAFDLPFLRSRLDRMTHFGQDGLQQVSASEGRRVSNKRTSECDHQALPRTQPSPLVLTTSDSTNLGLRL
ncbi:Bromodomain and PHD finger-containing protein [Actinidia chinensis var. chinensis]|uniref:Bromodomain and PHD finger-containing protein n=1 Tax=Actinidia chinensis var. chinensis TaxID=1590841 RepID=A0A2R6RXM9_ACTCC|nr:Bromodomain and PHD finger-containing protein [Actinidia chinensis var. chinensis]